MRHVNLKKMILLAYKHRSQYMKKKPTILCITLLAYLLIIRTNGTVRGNFEKMSEQRIGVIGQM